MWYGNIKKDSTRSLGILKENLTEMWNLSLLG